MQSCPVVVLISENALVRETSAEILRVSNLRVVTAVDGYEGVALFMIHCPDVAFVILDLDMNLRSGEETLLRLRQVQPTLKVILLSRRSFSEEGFFLARHEFAPYVRKPLDCHKLLAAVASLMTLPPSPSENRSDEQASPRPFPPDPHLL